MPISNFEPKIREIIDACSNCYKSCVVTMQHCFSLGGEHASHKHINMLKDCAEISKLTETFLLHNSSYSKDIAQLCATICEGCAKECLEMAGDDSQMKSCAEFCTECAELCRQL